MIINKEDILVILGLKLINSHNWYMFPGNHNWHHHTLSEKAFKGTVVNR